MSEEKRLKDTKIKYKISIQVIQKHIKEGSMHSNIPYLISLKIDKGHYQLITSFPYTQKGKRELIKTLKDECDLE